MPQPAPSSSSASPQGSGADHAHRPHRETIADTLISIIIAFALAFVFRGFVVEAFVIPTGSMAPTLMGAHMRFDGPETGYNWPVGPWETIGGNSARPEPVQGSPSNPIEVHDPMSGQQIRDPAVPIRAGDRILVLKYLYSVREPKPFEVVVFKNPTKPTENYIKRLIGLPGDQIAIVDGDIFVREPDAPVPDAGKSEWEMPGWTIRRKPIRAQRAVWQPIFDSRWGLEQQGLGFYEQPWKAADHASEWDVSGRHYEFTSGEPTTLLFDQGARRIEPGASISLPPGYTEWRIDDRYPYNEDRGVTRFALFPVSDLRLRAAIQPEADGLKARARIVARSHIFEAVLDGDKGTLSITPTDDAVDPVTASVTFDIPPLRAGETTDLEFWHVDQTLQLWLNGKHVAHLAYGDANGNGWTPAERFRNATGRDLDEVASSPTARLRARNPLAAPDLYHRPEVSFQFSGAPFKLHAVGLDRDIFYQPNGGAPPNCGLGTHPSSTLSLGKDQFFCMGDNSPNSEDGRTWGPPAPWVKAQLDGAGDGIVPRRLLLGKAFFVYFPSLHKDHRLPVPDFGRMRFIR
jgi:signal peptidase I